MRDGDSSAHALTSNLKSSVPSQAHCGSVNRMCICAVRKAHVMSVQNLRTYVLHRLIDRLTCAALELCMDVLRSLLVSLETDVQCTVVTAPCLFACGTEFL